MPGGHASPVRVAGVELPAGAVAQLALRLHRAGHVALSWHVGRAVDQMRDEVDLDARDYRDIVDVIDQGSPELLRLRDALERRSSLSGGADS
jgi:hypothetical protein